MPPMTCVTLDGVELEYELRGAEELVVLVHAGLVAEWFQPLVQERALTGRYQLVSYHRVGYAGSTHVAGLVSIAQQAVHCRALMHSLGIERTHVVGHSIGGMIALQLALDVPDRVSAQQYSILLCSSRESKGWRMREQAALGRVARQALRPRRVTSNRIIATSISVSLVWTFRS